jgi:uncharacterized membrane protein YjjP (DUF1212 family)
MLERLLQIASLAGALAALVFAWRGNWDAVVVAAALGGVAWFVRLRLELRALLPKEEETDET